MKMPQVHNRSYSHEGTGVRFLASISLSENGMKAVRMKNHVEGNLQQINSRRLHNLASKSDHREQKQRVKLRQSLRRMVAYRQVIQERTIARKTDYHQSLSWNYTEEGMRGDINKVLHDTNPVTIQRRKDRVAVENNRQIYREILEKSRDNLSQIFLAKRELQQINATENSKESVTGSFSKKKAGHKIIMKSEDLKYSTLLSSGKKSGCHVQIDSGDRGCSKNDSPSMKHSLRDEIVNGILLGKAERLDSLPPSVLTNLLKLRQIILPPIGVKFAHTKKLASPKIQDDGLRTIKKDPKSEHRIKMKKRFKHDSEQTNHLSKLHNEDKSPEMVKFHFPPVQVTKALVA